MELHGAEVWLTTSGSLVVTIPHSEHDRQSETQMRERFFRAVNHRFKGHSDEETFGRYVQTTQLAPLQIIEADPDMPTALQYGVVLVHNGVLL